MFHRGFTVFGQLLIMGLVLAGIFTSTACAQPLIVDDGRPNAQIIIAQGEDTPRVVSLAAEELQSLVKQMTGATLPIVHEPAGNDTIAIYVGRSSFTDELGITDEGLRDGAFRIASGKTAQGKHWLVLIGHDEKFTIKGPHTMQPVRNHPDRQRAIDEWDKLSGGKWGLPFLSYHRSYHRGLKISGYDQHGSLNAVYQFLRDLGFEWYMPGELGQITPSGKTIALPAGDKTVKPDFKLRTLHSMGLVFSSQKEEDVLWALRLGSSPRSDMVGTFELQSHGLGDVMSRDEMKQAHPEYYALWSGQRMTKDDGKPCLGSPGLVDEAVRYARAMFDVYDVPMVSMMPQDGYGRVCECDLCKDLATPERGIHGSMSDYVWQFVNKVAKEVYKTHPDKQIGCYAYGTYLLPPMTIQKLSPNVVVGIVHGRSGKFRDPSTRDKLGEIRQGWIDMSDHPLLGWEHYVFTHRGTIWPSFFPRQIAAELKAVKGETHGEVVEVAWRQSANEHSLDVPGFNHLNVFATARYWWDADADIDAMLKRYTEDFYGPAAAPMLAFLDESQGYWRDLQDNHQRIPNVLAAFEKAKAAAPQGSVYAQRIALIDDYLIPLRNLQEQLAKGRQGVPEARLYNVTGQTITLDGKLDEEAWNTGHAYGLRKLDGSKADVNTTFRTLWQGNRVSGTMYIGIRCEEPDIANMPVNIKPSDKNIDGIWSSDNIELLIETQGHSYYQIAIAPNGSVVDIDRRGGMNFLWDSGIKVKTSQGDDHWTLEIAIPVTGSDMADDPNHDLVGKMPTEMYPWHINVCRQRIRDGQHSFYAWSPTGDKGFHEIMKFGKLQAR